MRFEFYDLELSIEFESKALASEASWLRLKDEITDYWSGEDCKINDTICLTIVSIRREPRMAVLFFRLPCRSTS